MKAAVVGPTCPHLGTGNDPSAFFAFASAENRCYHGRRPAAPLLAHQADFCLSAAHTECPVYWQARSRAFPAQFGSADSAERSLSTSAKIALALAIGLVALGFTVVRFLPQMFTPPRIVDAPPLATLPAVPGNQIFVAEISSTTLRVRSPDSVASPASAGDLLDLKSGTTLGTSDVGNGYAAVAFPGGAEAYLAAGTELVTRDPIDATTDFDVVLNRGMLLVNLPGTSAARRRFLVESPDGAQAWISGSMLGLQYDSVKHELYVDCLRGVCGYLDDARSHLLPQGSHVRFAGAQVVSTGAGTQSELWQFVPNMVPTPTVTPGATPNLTPAANPNAAATQTCRYLKGLGTPCPAP